MSSDDTNSLPALPDVDIFDFNGSDDLRPIDSAFESVQSVRSPPPPSIDSAFESVQSVRSPPPPSIDSALESVQSVRSPPPLLGTSTATRQSATTDVHTPCDAGLLLRAPPLLTAATLSPLPRDGQSAVPNGTTSSFLSSVILTAASQLTDPDGHDSAAASTLDRLGLYRQLCEHVDYVDMLDTTSPTARLDRTRLEIPALRFEPSPDWLIHASRAQTLWLERLNAFYHVSMTPAVSLATVSTELGPHSSDPHDPELDCRRVFARSSALAQQGVESLAEFKVVTSPSSNVSSHRGQSKLVPAAETPVSSTSSSSNQAPLVPVATTPSSTQLVASLASQRPTRAMSLHELYTTVLLPGTLHAFDAKLRSMDREFKGYFCSLCVCCSRDVVAICELWL